LTEVIGEGPQTSEKINSNGVEVFIDDSWNGNLWLLFKKHELHVVLKVWELEGKNVLRAWWSVLGEGWPSRACQRVLVDLDAWRLIGGVWSEGWRL